MYLNDSRKSMIRYAGCSEFSQMNPANIHLSQRQCSPFAERGCVCNILKEIPNLLLKNDCPVTEHSARPSRFSAQDSGRLIRLDLSETIIIKCVSDCLCLGLKYTLSFPANNCCGVSCKVQRSFTQLFS
ncbi:hypothetical protein CEXT_699311 [Caerostris extrusa]|uniref:Uncharacterized protein n=1 Tax=Caerostris extrusa TaxID=172846 RepID=A0AAV4NH63_CAEEX|nr:hypothetical protein CEXT_699311 [Caerostris extrusa]